MKLRHLEYPYPVLPLSARADLLPERNVCSLAPAEDPADTLSYIWVPLKKL